MWHLSTGCFTLRTCAHEHTCKAIAISTLLSVAAVSRAYRDSRKRTPSSIAMPGARPRMPSASTSRSGAAARRHVTSRPTSRVPAAYRPLVATMLARSATFRRQCARLAAAPYLSIIIRAEAPNGTHSTGAHAHPRAKPTDGSPPSMQVAPSSRSSELIAHEFEHIIEQLDGVDLSSQVAPASERSQARRRSRTRSKLGARSSPDCASRGRSAIVAP